MRVHAAQEKLRWMCLAAAELVTGCTPELEIRLDDLVNDATQDDVARRLGPPLYVASLRDGREVWTFRERGLGYSRDMGAGFCREYVVTFDEQKLLRGWERQACD